MWLLREDTTGCELIPKTNHQNAAALQFSESARV
jgi:hypothetical protein